MAARRQDWCRPGGQTGESPRDSGGWSAPPCGGSVRKKGGCGWGRRFGFPAPASRRGCVRRAPTSHLCGTEGSSRLLTLTVTSSSAVWLHSGGCFGKVKAEEGLETSPLGMTLLNSFSLPLFSLFQRRRPCGGSPKARGEKSRLPQVSVRRLR